MTCSFDMLGALAGFPVAAGGTADVAAIQREFDALSPVTVPDAWLLLETGQKVIQEAQKAAGDPSSIPWYNLPAIVNPPPGLPGAADRQAVSDHLGWHMKTLTGIALQASVPAAYVSGDDLKKWVMQAFVEANAVKVGASDLDAAWSSMWSEIGAGLAQIPAKVLKAAADAAGAALPTVPRWVKVGGGLLIAGLLGLAGWRIAS